MHPHRCVRVANYVFHQARHITKNHNMYSAQTWRLGLSSRSMSSGWLSWLTVRTRYPDSSPQPSDGQDEAARAAILEKVMKGRQPTDLMLRCKWLWWRSRILKSHGKGPVQVLYSTLTVGLTLWLHTRHVLNSFLLGDVKTISGQFKRSDICTEHHLHVRFITSLYLPVFKCLPRQVFHNTMLTLGISWYTHST